MKNVLKYLGFLLFIYLIVWGSLFIPKPVKMPERTVHLGYPIPFVTLDFGDQATPMGGAPDHLLARNKFNITSSWENRVYRSRKNFVLSYAIVLFILYGAWWLIGKIRQ